MAAWEISHKSAEDLLASTRLKKLWLEFKPMCHCKQLNQSSLSSVNKSQNFGALFGMVQTLEQEEYIHDE